MADRWEGGAHDTVTSWGEPEVPPQQATVPSDRDPGPDPGSERERTAKPDRKAGRPRSRDRIATAVMIIGFLLSAVVPVMLCARAWHQAETVRGVGPTRGVFTVAACGDPQPAKNDRLSYTCTGTFVEHRASGRAASVTSDTDFPPGASKAAYLADDGDAGDAVHLANSDHAAAMVALWFTLACALACLEGAAVVMLSRRIRGELELSWPDKMGTRAFTVCGIGACLWMVALVALQIVYHFQ